MKYIKLSALCMVTYLSGVALFYLTGFQLTKWFFPEISVWWVFLETVAVGMVVSMTISELYATGALTLELSGNINSYTKELWREVIETQTKFAFFEWGFEDVRVFRWYESLFKASFGACLLLDLSLQIFLLVFIAPIKCITK